MNHLITLIGAYLATLGSDMSDIMLNETEWFTFKSEHRKSYLTNQEESIRSSIFAYNKNQVDKFNAEQSAKVGFEMDLNDLADISDIEIKMRNGYRSANISDGPINTPEAEKFLNDIFEDHTVKVPYRIDWRRVPGRVSRVKNQGSCGACWAFAATGALEGQERVRGKNDRPVELSAQNLVDCVTADAGCHGGLMKDAFDFIKVEEGIESERSYPYEGKTKKCRFQKDKVAFTDAGSAMLPIGDEERLKEVVAKFGPVAVAIDASSTGFQFYGKGVYYNKQCHSEPGELNHGVLVVGYGTDAKWGDYWIVKNSWGPQYGENGYIRMARNRENNCGIASAATIPIF